MCFICFALLFMRRRQQLLRLACVFFSFGTRELRSVFFIVCVVWIFCFGV